MWKKCLSKGSFKIYGVTSVWTKWQIIVPRETRRDFDIDIWDEFIIWVFKEIAFWIWRKKQNDRVDNDFIDVWKIIIWTKYQFVIPSTIRNSLNILPWDSLVLIWKPWQWVWFTKNDNIDFVFSFIKDELNSQKLHNN